jgi:hypothetical protein
VPRLELDDLRFEVVDSVVLAVAAHDNGESAGYVCERGLLLSIMLIRHTHHQKWAAEERTLELDAMRTISAINHRRC